MIRNTILISNFSVRKATVEDASAIHEILNAAFEKYRSYYTEEGFADTILSPQGVMERLQKMELYVAVIGNEKIVGTIGWTRITDEEAHIRGMAVHPDYHGTGIATALLKRTEQEIEKAGCNYITLDTTEVLKRAQRFYQKQGYERTGKVSDFFGMPIFEFSKKL
ncbi:MAG: GNAT family N-acetyltransferase [Candidatus Lokiarchaeota archaeon]|nr:GNAT family N-acetyltransferase [Candidatus Lokiarchaeota archaeon]